MDNYVGLEIGLYIDIKLDRDLYIIFFWILFEYMNRVDTNLFNTFILLVTYLCYLGEINQTKFPLLYITVMSHIAFQHCCTDQPKTLML